MTIHESIKSRVKIRNVKGGKERTEIRIYEKMSESRRSDYSKKTNIKIVRDEHGEMIKTAQGILCEQVDRDGNTTLKFLQTTSNASSSTVDNDSMPCGTTSFRNEETTQENKSNIWSDGDCKELLHLYYENVGQVGPFAKFKNKKQMWEFISDKITTKCSILYSPTQCENKYKNMLKKRNVAKKRNRISGSEKADIDFEDEFDLISSIDDNIEPEVCFGIGQHTIKKRKLSSPSSEEEGRKIQKSQNIFVLLQNMNEKKEAERERRHQEKLQVLRDLLSKNK